MSDVDIQPQINVCNTRTKIECKCYDGLSTTFRSEVLERRSDNVGSNKRNVHFDRINRGGFVSAFR